MIPIIYKAANYLEQGKSKNTRRLIFHKRHCTVEPLPKGKITPGHVLAIELTPRYKGFNTECFLGGLFFKPLFETNQF